MWADSFLLTLPTDMQQHHPAGDMFLSTRWRKSKSRRAELSHFFFFFFFVKSSVFQTDNYKTLNICRQLAASQSKVSGSKPSCTSQRSNTRKATRLTDLSQHFERLTSSEQSMDGGGGGGGGGGGVEGGDSPECPPLSDFLTPFPLPFLSRPGVAPRRAREWERTGKKTQWNNIAALPHTSCLPSLVSLPVWSVQLFPPIGLRPGVPVSFTGGWMSRCDIFFQRHLFCFIHVAASDLT